MVSFATITFVLYKYILEDFPMNCRVEIGKCLLLKILHSKKMSQVDLVALTGISKTQINEYINNSRKMSLSNAKLIAHCLHVHIDNLYEWKIKE